MGEMGKGESERGKNNMIENVKRRGFWEGRRAKGVGMMGIRKRGLERMGCEESGRGKGRREKVAMIKRDGRAGDVEGRRWERGFKESEIGQNANGRKGDSIKDNGRKGHGGRVRGKVWQKRGKR